MLSYLEYFKDNLGLPTTVIIVAVSIFFVLNIIGEMLELKGKVVPEFMKIRKHFSRKKKERETLAAMPDMMNEMKTAIDNFNSHYNKDNITMRDEWINHVDKELKDNSESILEIKNKIDDMNTSVTKLILDNKRETIISFAEKVSDYNFPVTREQFRRVDKIYQEYEDIIEERGFKNGEVEVSRKLINEAYQHRLINHTFVEDVRWHEFCDDMI